MKKSNAVGFIFFLLIGLMIGGWIVYKFKPLPEGKLIVNQSAIDSLNAFIVFADSIENLPMKPVVITTDTVYIKVPQYVSSTPIAEPDPIDVTITHYRDSLIREKQVSVWVDIMVKGYVEDLKIDWKYQPVLQSITVTTELPVFKPIITTIKVPKYITGHYLSFAAGGNGKMFTFGMDYNVVKKDRIYGLEYRRYGDQNVYGFQIGINLVTLFKKHR